MARSLAPHGTVAAYKRHLRAGESACPACLKAKREDEQHRRKDRAARAAEAAAARVNLPADAPDDAPAYRGPALDPVALAALPPLVAHGPEDAPAGDAEDPDDAAEDDAPSGYAAALAGTMDDARLRAALPDPDVELPVPDARHDLLTLRAVLWQSIRVAAMTDPTRINALTRELRSTLADLAALDADTETETEEDPLAQFDADAGDPGNVYRFAAADA